jgi:hypothetical protein
MHSDKPLLVRVRELLKELQWRSEGDHCSVCPECFNCAHKHGSREGGHDKDCELAAVLSLVEAEIPKLAERKALPQPTDGESYAGR